MKKDKYVTGFRWLAVYQMIGGLFGFYFVVRDLQLYFEYQIFPPIIFFLAILFFGYSILCGILLLQHRTKALEYSLANQQFQLIGFAGSGIVYKCIAGISFGFGIENSVPVTFGFRFMLSSFEIAVNRETFGREVVFNFVAAGIIYMLHHEIRANARERVRDQIGEIGSSGIT